ncbi:MAG: EAL domain-containing protein [Sphingomonas sp.]|nr:EAL domain-containing protein [Sphingomonas sp.]MBW0007593.1 EAL domain-containing protein [Sphingomonas sp.]
MSKRSEKGLEKKPWKLLLWTAVAGLIFGLIGAGEYFEDMLRVARNSFHEHDASGQVVVIKVDDQSLRQYGNWPWPRRMQGQLVDRLTAAGTKQIVYDINFSFPSNPADDRVFAQAIERSGRVTLLTRSRLGPNDGKRIDSLPLPMFARHAQLGVSSVEYNWENAVWRLPYAATIHGQTVPSFAAAMAGAKGSPGSNFFLDYSLKLQSIPAYSAGDILSGKVGAKELAGKRVIIGVASELLGDGYFIPGYGRSYGVYVHAYGAETLVEGRPVDLGWFPGFLLGLIAVAIALLRRRSIEALVAMSAATAALVVAPAFTEAHLIFADVTPGLFVLLVVASVLGWRKYRARGWVNSISNLPNLNALRAHQEGRSQALVAARILNYEEIVATLPSDGERQLVEQIVSRLKVGSPNRVLYQGDAGIFAWFEAPQQPFGNHLEALHALFRNPARVAGLSIDLTISFGVEVGSGRSIANRLASALVAADEAAHDGLKWKYHDPETLETASWRLSMLSQLDEAIDRGEVWVAYQPKLELGSKRIIGAEALARWTHPEKGPIAASEFVAAAEQHNRIGKLTDFVLEQAVGAAAAINKRGVEFEIAVNLSARLLTDKGFTLRLAAMLARHSLPARHLTLELTETAALTNSGEGLEMIARIRDLGVNIAIDDYGTGLSTLDYLKKIPANEIKIDQSFVKGIADNRSDRLMVQSTIGLAHSLGRKVVAEGVEHRDILELLIEMECDIAQGFAIGRPMSLDSLTKRLASDRKRSAA